MSLKKTLPSKVQEVEKKGTDKKSEKGENTQNNRLDDRSGNTQAHTDMLVPADDKEVHDATANQTIVPLSGSISIGGNLLADIDLKWWHSQIGLVQQEPFLFNDTIFCNVAYRLTGMEQENAPECEKMELIKAACRDAFADEFIDRLPDGYYTTVGDGGTRLSGGQRQRIAIARSIIKDPKIVILDEATSAIDVRGEKIVQAALDRVSKNRTTITIAHQLSTIQRADQIVVLREGGIVESGTHKFLLQNESGAYHGLVAAQTLWDA